MVTHITRSALAVAVLVAGFGTARAEGPYVGGSLGTPDEHGSINGVGGNGSGVAGKLYGGYAPSPNYGFEAGLFDLGRMEDGAGRVRLRGVSIDAVGRHEFAPRWSMLGRVGLAEGRFTTTAGDASSPALKLGVGLEYDLGRQVALRAEYEQYRFSNAFDAKPRVGAFTVGVKVGF